MISSYTCTNICGPFYKSGNITFIPDKNILFTPIGNKIKIVDLENNITNTMEIEARSDI